VTARFLGDNFHNYDRVDKLVDVGCACKDDCAAIVDLQDFVLASDGNFAKIEVHHAKPEGAHCFAQADVFKEVQHHAHYAHALADDREAEL